MGICIDDGLPLILLVIWAAAVWIESPARRARRVVVWTCVWPSNLPIIVRLWPKTSALEAYE